MKALFDEGIRSWEELQQVFILNIINVYRNLLVLCPISKFLEVISKHGHDVCNACLLQRALLPEVEDAGWLSECSIMCQTDHSRVAATKWEDNEEDTSSDQREETDMNG